MFRAVALEFGRDKTEETSTFERVICPGEENCNEFLSQRGKNRQEKEQRCCIGNKCRAFASKFSDVPEKTERYLDNLTEKVFDLRLAEKAGYPVSQSRMTVIEFECLKRVVNLFDSFERNLKLESNKFLKFLCEKPTL